MNFHSERCEKLSFPNVAFQIFHGDNLTVINLFFIIIYLVDV